MEESYQICLGNQLAGKRKVTLLGKVTSGIPGGVVLEDNTGSVQVQGVESSVRGIIEVRGLVEGPKSLRCENFTQFDDEDFDFQQHSKLVEFYQRFPMPTTS